MCRGTGSVFGVLVMVKYRVTVSNMLTVVFNFYINVYDKSQKNLGGLPIPPEERI